MLKFFRRIRRKLLNEGSLRKYMAYAIGEIALVVIGILIALQVNDWNKERKDRSLEISTLLEISVSLQDDLNSIGESRQRMNERIEKTKLAISYLEACKAYDDTLAYALMYSHGITSNFFNFSGYKLLEDRGIDLIKNDSIRRMISNYYEHRVPRTLIQENAIRQGMASFRDYKEEFVYVLPGSGGKTVPKTVPYKYEDLCENSKFIMKLRGRLAVFTFYTTRLLEITKSSTEELLKVVEGELKRLK